MIFTQKCVLVYLVFQINFTNAVDINIEEALYAQYSDNPRVKLDDGLVIIGNRNYTIDQGKPYFSFLGIQYAKPPINGLRFRAPVPNTGKCNSKVLHAFREGPVCVQSYMDGDEVIGSEDCLYLNVYTPKLLRGERQLLPVMVWLYGGGFYAGDANYASYGPDYFLNEDVIVVTFNYRLGIFGFLSTEDYASPGNFGLKDQLLALKWVNTNIEQFGGDPNKVTVFGQSAGAASISYLSQTPLSKGLMHRAILQSGSSISIWALSRNPSTYARLTAEHLAIDYSNTQVLVDELRRVDYIELQKASFQASLNFFDEVASERDYPIGPTIEPNHPGAIVTTESYERLLQGGYHKIPYIIGFNSEEGANFFDSPLKVIQIYSILPRRNRLTIVPASMNVDSIYKQTIISLDVYNFYFGNSATTELQDKDLIRFNSDEVMDRGVLESAAVYSRKAPVHLYRFSYTGGQDTKRGVGHGEELPYMWRINYENTTRTHSDLQVRRRLIKLWTSFAKYGKPVHEYLEWHTASSEGVGNLLYMDIGKDLVLGLNPELQSARFWQRLFQKYGERPYATY